MMQANGWCSRCGLAVTLTVIEERPLPCPDCGVMLDDVSYDHRSTEEMEAALLAEAYCCCSCKALIFSDGPVDICFCGSRDLVRPRTLDGAFQ